MSPSTGLDLPLRLTRTGRALLVGSLVLVFVASTTGNVFGAAAAALMLGLVASSVITSRVVAPTLARLAVRLTVDGAGQHVRGARRTLFVHLTNPRIDGLPTLTIRTTVGGEPTLPPALIVDVPPLATARIRIDLVLPQVGHWRTRGLELELDGWLALSRLTRYVPVERALTTYPAPITAIGSERAWAAVGAARDLEGRHRNRSTGRGLELRELRDYVPGDPIKTIAWKATARRQRPLVRVFEEETIRRLQVLVDIGPTMRAGHLGKTALDTAIDVAASVIRRHRLDRVGVTSFDHRVYGHLRPGTGATHNQRLIHHLLDATTAVDDDLTEITDAELIARVGAFLELQEGRALRHHAADPAELRVARSLADPVRELYDEAAVFTAVSRYLVSDRDRGHAVLFAKVRPAEDLFSARLRVFCALRNIRLPYRLTGAPDSRETGLSAAISRNLLPGAARTLVVLSDLRGLSPTGAGIRALRLARAHNKTVVVMPMGSAEPATEIRRAMLASRVVVAPVARAPQAVGAGTVLSPRPQHPSAPGRK